MQQRSMMKKKYGLNTKKLKLEMDWRGWNFSDLAREMGIPRQRLGAMLHAEYGPSLVSTARIARALGINYKELLL